jgi:hypothetical protein
MQRWQFCVERCIQSEISHETTDGYSDEHLLADKTEDHQLRCSVAI